MFQPSDSKLQADSSQISYIYFPVSTQIYRTSVDGKDITFYVVSSNPEHGEVHSMQHYVIKFVSDLRQLSGFLGYSGFLPQ
jgi:hypothetical protein